MYFKYPELLFALFLLIIPIIVHLFQLRKFQKEDFTNVRFLKKISRQTRKSSRLKKWLVLTSRLLALAFLIFAFAQPYLPASSKAFETKSSLIYLDNSFSMQATGQRGQLLPAAIQNLLENLPQEENLNLLTNDEEYLNIEATEIRNILQNLDYTATPIEFENLKLRAENFFQENPADEMELVILSDLQQNSGFPAKPDAENFNFRLVPYQPKNISNISLDSTFIAERNLENISLKVQLSTSASREEQIPVSIMAGDELLGKSAVKFSENNQAEVVFTLPNGPIDNGRIEIEDTGLQYDNELFFSISKIVKIKAALISENSDSFLKRIYTEPEFELVVFPFAGIDYNQLSGSQLIILDEMEEISPSLSTILQKRMDEGAIVVLIPSVNAEITSYNAFLRNSGAPTFETLQSEERKITNIGFEHPLYASVFEEQVENFEYPSVQSYFSLNRPGSPVLQFQDNAPFLTQSDRLFIFTSALGSKIGNFQQSPIVVPTFYNMGRMALQSRKIYYEIGKNNSIDISVTSENDEVVHITSEEENFIPQQQSFSEKIQINTSEIPTVAGNYQIEYKTENVGHLSYNYDRSESELNYLDPENLENVQIFANISEYFESTNAVRQITALWKWFVIFALLFLIVEMLLLKYLK
ncbi:BatA domain-containing protein [Salegentibacter sp. F188]|uniref:BatA domain-containing protein n=1 Tax=Autumnicola patrickiae TaxID=3075591 RepID=A0ABU3E3U0_9FLAO|nr:BatA domain-containing protein [Salegentibacter sp. F188]MDT0690568.1 BatA domain-containing protein [Salegentibacter sp. F188]